jgi:D-3-phosphoglycerate dehydrogenase
MIMDDRDWSSIEIENNILAEVGCRVEPLGHPDDDALMTALTDADAVLPRYINIRRRHIETMDRCKIIARSGIGVDIVDVEAASERGIWVTNVPEYCVAEVAEHAAALILACFRKIYVYANAVRRGHWTWRSGQPIGRMKTAAFGLIGYGKIGRALWERMRPFTGRGLIYDPYVPEEQIRSAGADPADLDTLLSSADIVHVQCPLTPDTHHLIDASAIGRMKKTAILVNAARGPIVDEKALIESLKAGTIAGAALDDLEEEPAKQTAKGVENPLLSMENVIVTPHTAWYSEQAAAEVKQISATEIARVLRGQRPLYPVNDPVR